MTKKERMILESIKRLAPSGTALAFDGHPLGDGDVKIVCGGRDFDMGYFCTLSPCHSERCWSTSKKVWFDDQRDPPEPEEGRKSILAEYIDYGLSEPLLRRRERIVEDIHLLADAIGYPLPMSDSSDSWTTSTLMEIPEGKVRDKILILWGRYEYVAGEIQRLYEEIDEFLDDKEQHE